MVRIVQNYRLTCHRAIGSRNSTGGLVGRLLRQPFLMVALWFLLASSSSLQVVASALGF